MDKANQQQYNFLDSMEDTNIAKSFKEEWTRVENKFMGENSADYL